MLEMAVIYLAAAIVAVPIAKRLGLGSVLGYLIAGILIGPFVFKLVGDQTDVMHFAEFGVVMMLFLVGLEFGLFLEFYVFDSVWFGIRSIVFSWTLCAY